MYLALSIFPKNLVSVKYFLTEYNIIKKIRNRII
jgi:hypothetical protein